MKEKIFYLSFYDFPNAKYKRVSSLAAINQVDYVKKVIQNIGFPLQMVVPSWYDDCASEAAFSFSRTINFEGLNYVFAPSFGTKNKYLGYLKIIISWIWLFFYLLKNVSSKNTVLLYHTPWLVLPVLWAKKIKKFKLILDVEEIYADVTPINNYFNKLEYKIINKADAYLFSTEILANKLSCNKPYSVYYGNYFINEILESKFDDGKIHLLYAGIIDTEKLGAFNAIEIAPFLNENYTIHVIGFGEVNKLLSRIDELNNISPCKIIYDGQLKGERFIRYCQKCHIGLSTQKLEADFVDSSFPSKILSYLNNNLQVVSGYVSVVAHSKIADNVFFYHNDDPVEIANTIKKVTFDNSARNKIQLLNDDFHRELEYILNFKN